jgi:iron(III) transport system permease protein
MDTFDLPGVKDGELTLYHWKQVVNDYDILIKPFLNSILIGIGVVGVVAVIGTTIITVLSTISYVLPSWAIALPWVEIFMNTGLNMAPGFLEYATGLKVPPWLVFGPLPIIIVIGIHYFPFVFLLVSAALRNVNSELEETAELLGASRLTILRTITLPIVLGFPARFTVLSVQIRSLMEVNLNSQANILAFMLIVFCILVIILNNRVIGLRKGFETIGGKGVRKRLTPLGKLGVPIATSVIILLTIIVIFPLALLVWTSFMMNDGDYGISNFTLHYWAGVVDPSDPEFTIGEPGVFRNPKFFSAAKNTFLLSFLGGTILGVLGMLVGYVVVMGRGKRLSVLLEWISFAPLLIPGIAFGAIYISLFGVSRGPIPALYGTFAILLLAVIGKKIPYASRCGISAMYQPSKELEEAGKVLGAGWFRRFCQIIWPLTKNGFSSGFLLVFITTTRELSVFILLVTGRTQLLTTLIFETAEFGTRQLSCALMTTLVILSLAMIGIYRLYEKYSKKSLMEKGIL